MQSAGLLKISRTVRIDAYVVLKFVKYSDVGKFGPGAQGHGLVGGSGSMLIVGPVDPEGLFQP